MSAWGATPGCILQTVETRTTPCCSWTATTTWILATNFCPFIMQILYGFHLHESKRAIIAAWCHGEGYGGRSAAETTRPLDTHTTTSFVRRWRSIRVHTSYGAAASRKVQSRRERPRRDMGAPLAQRARVLEGIVSMVIIYSRVWINRLRLPILLEVS